jgi:DNA-binding GntR family transcriptional regulator
LLSESAYQALRSSLVQVEIMPGEQLNENELKKSLGLGASPVREAIRRLEFEKLVAIFPRSGTFATEIALRPLRAITELRLPMEDLAAQLASQRGSLAEKENLIDLAERQYQTTDLQECITLDATFHRSIYAMTRNEFLADSLNVYFNLALRQWYYCSKVIQTPDWISVDNRPIAAAIMASDAETAGQHLREHIRHDSQEVHDILTAYGL